MVISQARLTVTANIELFAMNTLEAGSTQAALAAQATIAKWMEDAAATELCVLSGDYWQISALDVRHVGLRRRPVKRVPASWLFIATMVGSAANHGIAAFDFRDWPTAFWAELTILCFPLLVCLKLLVARNAFIQSLISKVIFRGSSGLAMIILTCT